jgi:hypothetical protein
MRRYLPSFAHLAVSLLFYPVSLLLVSVYFSAEERGVYFSLTAFVVLQTLFDLGIVQASVTILSREFAGLKIDDSGAVNAARERAERILEVLSHVSRWLRTAGFLSLGVVGVLGCVVMINSGVAARVWVPAVGTTVFGVMATLWVLPLQIAMEGANEVQALGRARALGNLARVLTLAGGIILYPSVAWLGLSAVVQALVLVWATPPNLKRMLTQSQQRAGAEHGVWRDEVIPFQRKLAVTWLGGSLVILPLVPGYMMAFGPEAAGRFGLTVTAFQSIVGIAVLWQTVSLPRIAGLVVEESSAAAFVVWKKEFVRSVGTFVFLTLVFLALVELSPLVYDVRDRVVSRAAMVWLAWGFFVTMLTYSCSYVMRAHKTEPFILQYMSWAILSAAALLAAVLLKKQTGYAMGFSLATTVAALAVYLKFRKSARLLEKHTQ